MRADRPPRETAVLGASRDLSGQSPDPGSLIDRLTQRTDPGIARPPRRLLRRLPRVPRRDHRQRRLPVAAGVVPDHVHRRAVLGPQRLQHRLRRVPHRLRPADRPAGSTPRVRRPGCCSSRSRPRSAGWRRRSSCSSRPASCRPSAPPCSCPRRSPSSSRPSPASAGRTRSVCGAPRPPSRPASARPSAARWSQIGDWRWAFLVNLPFGVVALWASRSQLVESRAPGRRAVPDLVGAALMAAGAGAPHPRHRQERGLGLDQPPGPRHPGRRGRALRPLRDDARGATPRRCSTRRCCACRRSPSAPSPPWSRASGSTPTCSPTSCGCSTSGGTTSCAPASRSCRRRGGRRRRGPARARWPSGSATGCSSCPVRSSGPAPTSGTTSRSGSSRRSGPSGCRGRCSAASGSARPCRCSAAPRWRPCRAAATPPPPRWSRARASSVACSASPSSS